MAGDIPAPDQPPVPLEKELILDRLDDLIQRGEQLGTECTDEKTCSRQLSYMIKMREWIYAKTDLTEFELRLFELASFLPHFQERFLSSPPKLLESGPQPSCAECERVHAQCRVKDAVCDERVRQLCLTMWCPR